MRKSDVRKQALAWLVKTNTVVGDEWVCQTLAMGDRSNISRAVGRFRKKKEKPVIALIKKLHVCTDPSTSAVGSRNSSQRPRRADD